MITRTKRWFANKYLKVKTVHRLVGSFRVFFQLISKTNSLPAHLLLRVYPCVHVQCRAKYRVALQLRHSLKFFLPFFSFGFCAAGAFARIFACS